MCLHLESRDAHASSTKPVLAGFVLFGLMASSLKVCPILFIEMERLS